MKTTKGLRDDHADELRKAKRLEPIHKSGKERHALYSKMDEDDEDDELHALRAKPESILDYLDDEE